MSSPSLSDLIEKLKSGEIYSEEYQRLAKHFLNEDGIYHSLINGDFKVNDVLKLPDRIANVYGRSLPCQYSSESVARTILESIKKCEKSDIKFDEKFLNLISRFCLIFFRHSCIMDDYLKFQLSMPEEHLCSIVDAISDRTLRTYIYRALMPESTEKISKLYSGSKYFVSDLTALLCVHSGFDSNQLRACMCYLSSKNSHLLDHFLTVWGDPIIAKSKVTSEISYYTKCIFWAFIHVPKELLIASQHKIATLLSSGVPHHFESADLRTVQLAHFLSQFIIKTFLFWEKNEPIEEKIYNPQDQLSLDILASYDNCCDKTKSFWYSELAGTLKVATEDIVDNDFKDLKLEESDDSDDDLDPIDSLEAPIKCQFVYLRDFIDKLPGWETEDDLELVLQKLPRIIERQLSLEHQDFIKLTLDVVFKWENKLESVRLDNLRSEALTSILLTTPQLSLSTFVNYFIQKSPELDVYRKCMSISVLSSVTDKITLKTAPFLANPVFQKIFGFDECIWEQESPVQIPLILLGSKIISSFPEYIVKQSHIISYLRCLAILEHKNVSSGIKDAISYSVHKIIKTFGANLSNELGSSIKQIKNWTQN